MKFIKILENIKLEKNVSIFMCVFLVLVYFIYRKMYSCKKSIENMAILDDNQIKQTINKYYLSNEYLIDITSLAKRIQDKGILIEGNIDVTGNIKANGNISNQNISLTDLNHKLKKFCIYSMIEVGDNFRNFEFNIGFPNLNLMIPRTRYWIFAAHECKFFIWGFYLFLTDKYTLKFWIRNKTISGRQLNDQIDIIDDLVLSTKTNYYIKFTGPNVSSSLGKKDIGILVTVNKQEIIVDSGIKETVNKKEIYGASIPQRYLPDKNVTFFEGWRNNTVPFLMLKTDNTDTGIKVGLSAFDLYKSSTKLPSIKWL